MNFVYDKKENCCGCTACKYVCPVNAIEMVRDTEGFLYPQINQELCIDCKKCILVCAFQKEEVLFNKTPEVFAVKHKSEQVRESSTSGGVFTAISDYFLKNNGIVYGVKFDDKFNVMHDKATTAAERDKFRGSKYVQSSLGNTYVEIAELLKNEKKVLFTGTPCQVSGLLNFLYAKKINCENLITVDTVCYGVPSPLMWENHIKSLERKHKVANYFFRSKIIGWHESKELVEYSNDKFDYKTTFFQKHKVLFYSCLILRPSCHVCRFTSINRVSDITMADFWGIEKSMPDFDDNKGISLVLVNSDKGKSVFDKISESLIVRPSNASECLQPQLQQPVITSPLRNSFWEDYYRFGYKYICKKYAKCSFLAGLKSFVILIRKKLLKY
jgi:coenzyme F420-reducing hydrogenase beta subunit